MTRTLFWMALAVAMSAWTIGLDNRAAAQESAEATAEADADADANQSGEASADANAETGSQTSEASSSGESTSETATEQSASTSTTKDSTSEASSTNNESTNSALSPPGDRGEGQSGSTQSDDQEQSLIGEQQSTDRDASARGRTSTDVKASAQRRGDAEGRDRDHADRRGRDDRSRDMRSGIRFRAGRDRGLAIDTIESNSVFYDSGLRRGDVVISIGNRPIRSEADFTRYVTVHRGERVPVVVMRDGRRETVYITYEDDVVAAEQPDMVREPVAAGSRPYFGVVFDGRVRDAAVVQAVHPDSPADQAGLQPGDEILALNGERVYSYQDAIDMIRSTRPGDRIDIDFSRRVDNRTQAVIDSQPGGELRTATNAPSVGVETDARADRDRSVETRRVDADREADRRDRDRADDRRLLNRDLLRGRN